MTDGGGHRASTCYASTPRLVHSIGEFEVVEDASARGGARLRRNGRELPQPVPGVVLEAQYCLEPEGSVVLLLTDDSPYEETLHVVLLDGDGRLLEHQRVGEAMAPGVLGQTEILGPRTLGFRFWPGHRHRLEIHAQPQGRLRKRWMSLSRRPEPERGASS